MRNVALHILNIYRIGNDGWVIVPSPHGCGGTSYAIYYLINRFNGSDSLVVKEIVIALCLVKRDHAVDILIVGGIEQLALNLEHITRQQVAVLQILDLPRQLDGIVLNGMADIFWLMNHGQRVGNHLREGAAHRRRAVHRCIVNGRKQDIGFVLKMIIRLGSINLNHNGVAGLSRDSIDKRLIVLVIHLEAVDGVAAHHRNHHLTLVARFRTGNRIVGIQCYIVANGEFIDCFPIILIPDICLGICTPYCAVKNEFHFLAYHLRGVVPLKFYEGCFIH